jgi:hypothetical protein
MAERRLEHAQPVQLARPRGRCVVDHAGRDFLQSAG